jgi:hypothetical protein
MSFRNASDALIKATNKVFGQTVTYERASDSVEADITAIITNQYVEIEGVGSHKPIARIKLDDLDETPDEGDAITTADGDEYEVIVVQSDPSRNEATLILKKIN